MARILVIETDKLLADIYKQALTHTGNKVVLAHNAQAAINAADKHKLDLVIMDIQLNGHNGVEFLYEFSSYPEWGNIPIIINSLISPKEFNSNVPIFNKLHIKSVLYKPTTSLKDLISEVSKATNKAIR